MGSHATDFRAVTAAAFDRLRGMNDEQCREVELSLFEVASRHHGAPDAADEVLSGLQELPHRAFRYHVLGTIRALAANMKVGRSPADLREVLESYLMGEPGGACDNLKATDMDRYRAAGH